MKLTLHSACLFAAAILAPASCTMPQQSVSTVVNSNYDKEKDQTTHSVVPFGSVILPGKWDEKRYNAVSGQHFFADKDSVEIAIAFNRYDKYEFNPSGKLKGHAFVKGFYEWDSQYFVSKYGMSRKVLEEDSAKHYMVYRIFAAAGSDTYFLVGEKNGYTSNFSISRTDKWTEQKKIEFLKGLFLGKKEE